MKNIYYRILWKLLVNGSSYPNDKVAFEVKGLGNIKHLAKNSDGDLVIIVDGAGKL